jgi:hypothetical protein
MPEKESFIYSDGPQYVCSSLIAKIYKEAGLFGDLEIEPQEFTQKDVYRLNFYETDPNKLPKVCTEENPNLPYCMINGQYKILLPDYNFINPYKGMNEKCPSSAPKYERPTDC